MVCFLLIKIKKINQILCYAQEQTMIRNYVTVAFRNMKRHKLYTTLNILGLAIGMASGFLIMLFVIDELSYDQFHKNVDQIFRFELNQNKNGKDNHYMTVSLSMGESLKRHFPEIQETVRIHSMWGRPIVEFDQKSFFEKRIFFADKTLFDVFSFPFLQGDAQTALQDPNAIVLTQSMAQKYFPATNAIGKTIKIDNGRVEAEFYVVSGIVQDPPGNSHFKFDFLISFQNFEKHQFGPSWAHLNRCHTYLRMRKNASVIELHQRLPDFLKKNEAIKLSQAHFDAGLYEAILRPINNIHLANLDNDLEPGRDIFDLYLISSVGILIVLVACINYINLSTARSGHKAREVGVRKLVGAFRNTLIRQFYTEAFIMTGAAFLVALALTELCLPWFEVFVGKTLHLSENRLGIFGTCSGLIVLFVGAFSGIYPAWFLSSFQPVAVLKGSYKIGGAALFRKGLVILQFIISTGLILVTLIMYYQLDYMKSERLGFDQSHVLVITSLERRPVTRSTTTSPTGETIVKASAIDELHLKQELLRNPQITHVSGASGFPANGIVGESDFFPNQKPDAIPIKSPYVFVDPDFVQTLGLNILEGRNFGKTFGEDLDAVIVNEAFARKAGWDSAVNHTIERRSKTYSTTTTKGKDGKYKETFREIIEKKEKTVIGVVENFHFQSLHNTIDPVVLQLPTPDDGIFRYFAINIHTESIPETLRFIENTWQLCVPSVPLEYVFLDNHFEKLYRAETQWMHTFGLFAILAVFVGCLGVFGLAAFAAEQRTKEIGIRKILGASVGKLVLLLSKDLLRLVIWANVIAWPFIYWTMHNWLANFAYRIELDIGIFLQSGGITLLIALMTVGYQAWRTARANPVDALRYE